MLERDERGYLRIHPVPSRTAADHSRFVSGIGIGIGIPSPVSDG